MNLTITRGIENNKFTTLVAFKEFGGIGMTSEDEMALLQNYPIILTYGEITFSDKFKVVSGNVVQDSTGDTVTLILSERKTPLTQVFQVRYEVSTGQILDAELGTSLISKELVAQAKCILFENKVKERITSLLTIAKTKNNSFEINSPIDVVI
ncbi:hypothetical protein [Clostridium tagluense]|uniref:Uncharacterized protein n=1 Tax=Clostridium tagluense TaxID=360422 RepID=A0A401UQF5_9CLOT|nr:hypothetical protein [Clostridium tagluense]GCD11775.1 hypothetical protein Ctaglu_33980 [Clostridium tagluense]